MKSFLAFFLILDFVLCPLMPTDQLSAQTRGVEYGSRFDRLLIKNVIIVDGKGTPPRGPSDVIIEDNTIRAIRGTRGSADAYAEEAHMIDGSGMYLLPGIINLHAHIHESRAGQPLPFEYLYKLWLSCGITTVRDVGSTYRLTIEERRKSAEGSIAAPRIFLYMRASGGTPEEARESVRRIASQGADGVKIFGMDRDIMQALCDEAHKHDLRIAHHVGVEETDAWDDAACGVTTIEHWYGVPDAALHGSQNFPASYNYSDEGDRFRYAGHLWREADPQKLKKVLTTLVENNVGWCPTFVIYESSRDFQRARTQPWFDEYLHPAVAEYFLPNPRYHGSYQWNWTTTDEVFWKDNYRIWMNAVREFAKMGGVVGAGEDAGYIYQLYGFALIRELELHHEAGFHPIDVIQHATGNNAALLGMEDKLGRIRVGYLADVILVDGNPLENLKFLYPTGVMDIKEGELINRGGVAWTIKDGFIYHGPTLRDDVKKIVNDAKSK